MEVKIDQLIEKIKSEGVESARKNADEIIQKAKNEADTIVSDAKKEAEKIINDAKKQTALFQNNAELAIQQAARDSELVVKTHITALFDQVFKRKAGNALSPDFIKTLIEKIVTEWGKGNDVDVLVNEKDQKALESLLTGGIKDAAKEGITLKISNDISEGFRIGLKGEDVYYDFSDETISEMLKSFLNPKLKEILETQDG